jgi:hypothetical protein
MRRALVFLPVIALAACGGGGGAGVQPAAAPAETPATNPGPVTQATTTAKFMISVPAASNTQAASRMPAYISVSTQSIVITLATVNGASFTGSAASTATNLTISNPACSNSSGTLTCTMTAPAVPGSDTFAVKTYDAQQTISSPATAAGNVLSIATVPLTVVAGVANAPATPLVLNGVPAALAISALPAGTAGAALAATAFIVTAKDADGNTIVGSYANPVTLADNDSSGATALVTSGSDNPPAGELVSSSDAAKLSYTGLAIPPATISAAASGATSASGSFVPPLQPIVVTTSDALNPSFIGVDLYATSGAGASGSFTVSEAGWTNTPYDKSLTATSGSGCNSIGTVVPSGNTFDASVAISPAPGICAVTLSDGAGQSQAVTLAYTNFTYTGGDQNISLPANVTQVTVTAAGAQGGSTVGNSGGQGGSVTAQIPVSSGSLIVRIGQAGNFNGGIKFGGGGPAGGATPGTPGDSGGGYSGVFQSGNPLLVAGGGGGGAFGSGPGHSGANGGAGGQVGAAGFPGGGTGGLGGGGGQANAGGAGGAAATDGTCTGANSCGPSVSGSSLAGASGGSSLSSFTGGGGGGGGYFGGGGGGAGDSSGGGGGGSSFVVSPIGTPTYATGTQSGNGQITIIW